MRQRKQDKGQTDEMFSVHRGDQHQPPNTLSSSPPGGSGPDYLPLPTSIGEPQSKRRVVKVEREVPAETRNWLDAGFFFLAVAVSAAFVSVALSKNVQVRASELWTISGAAVGMAAICFLAHLDVNRGRREKRSEVIEEKPGDRGPD